MSRTFVVAVVAAATSGACNGGGIASPVSPSNGIALAGTEWALIEVSGQPVDATEGRGTPTVTLAVDTGQVAGFTGCNRVAGTYVLSADRLSFGLLASTRVFCLGQMDLEQRYLSTLEATRGYRIAGRQLELVGQAGVLARFEAK
jgi:heat shock protein HslJ